ncbi:MAG: hypothetical protein BRD30_02755, partial [Bacteroidetes bacterium QH_2_63_10]
MVLFRNPWEALIAQLVQMGSPHRENAPLPGQTLAESNFRQQFEALVIGIIDADAGAMTFNPAPS